MIDLSINKVGLEHNIQKAKENHIIIPTIAQMQNPDLIPEKIKAKLSTTGLWDVDPVNLFRISWHNEAKESGGLFQAVPNYVEIPTKLVSFLFPDKASTGALADIDRLEDLSAKIFAQVKADPKKLPQIRKFMDYYLPTTLKLLNAYDRMGAQGVNGEIGRAHV